MAFLPRQKFLIIFILAFLIGGGGVYYLARTHPSLLGFSGGNSEIDKESDALIKDVGKLMLLPDGETPTIATVTDPEKVREQPFFRNSQSGDRVLVYTNAKKAILYRPSENKIIEVGAINISQQNTVNPTSAVSFDTQSPTPIVDSQ